MMGRLRAWLDRLFTYKFSSPDTHGWEAKREILYRMQKHVEATDAKQSDSHDTKPRATTTRPSSD